MPRCPLVLYWNSLPTISLNWYWEYLTNITFYFLSAFSYLARMNWKNGVKHFAKHQQGYSHKQNKHNFYLREYAGSFSLHPRHIKKLKNYNNCCHPGGPSYNGFLTSPNLEDQGMPLREQRYRDFWKLNRNKPIKSQGVGGECSWQRRLYVHIYICM